MRKLNGWILTFY